MIELNKELLKSSVTTKKADYWLGYIAGLALLLGLCAFSIYGAIRSIDMISRIIMYTAFVASAIALVIVVFKHKKNCVHKEKLIDEGRFALQEVRITKVYAEEGLGDDLSTYYHAVFTCDDPYINIEKRISEEEFRAISEGDKAYLLYFPSLCSSIDPAGVEAYFDAGIYAPSGEVAEMVSFLKE